MELVNGRITTDWIDRAVSESNAKTAKLIRLGKTIGEIYDNRWPLRLNNIGKKLRIIIAWFFGESDERRLEIAGEYIADARTTSNQITELQNSADIQNTTLNGLQKQITKVINLFTTAATKLEKNHVIADAAVIKAMARQTTHVEQID
jgi:hypothetical protein